MAYKKRGPRRFRKRQSTRKGLVTKRQMRGGKLKSRNNPSPTTYEPWNNLVLSQLIPLASGAARSITLANILGFMRDQLGIPTLDPRIKLRSIQVFDLNGRAIELYLNSLVSGTQTSSQSDNVGPVATVVDYPGRNSWASCKLAWPAAEQNTSIILGTTYSYNVAEIVVDSLSDTTLTGTSVLVKISLAWRTATVRPDYSTLRRMKMANECTDNISVEESSSM